LKVNYATLLNYTNKDKLFKGKYMIKRVNKKKMWVQLVKTLISCTNNGNSSLSPGYFHILSCFILLLLIFSAISKHLLKKMKHQQRQEGQFSVSLCTYILCISYFNWSNNIHIKTLHLFKIYKYIVMSTKHNRQHVFF